MLIFEYYSLLIAKGNILYISNDGLSRFEVILNSKMNRR